MATITQNLAALQQARTDIAEAIENKGVTLEEGAGFTDFPQAINSISIPYTETDNDAGGITITIGDAANG